MAATKSKGTKKASRPEASKEVEAFAQTAFRLSDEARRFYKSGPPFLQRYLPFWVANFIARMTVMLLPFFALLFPLFKMASWTIAGNISQSLSSMDLSILCFRMKSTWEITNLMITTNKQSSK